MSVDFLGNGFVSCYRIFSVKESTYVSPALSKLCKERNSFTTAVSNTSHRTVWLFVEFESVRQASFWATMMEDVTAVSAVSHDVNSSRLYVTCDSEYIQSIREFDSVTAITPAPNSQTERTVEDVVTVPRKDKRITLMISSNHINLLKRQLELRDAEVNETNEFTLKLTLPEENITDIFELNAVESVRWC